MNKLKYLAAVLIGVATLGLHQAKADYHSTLNLFNVSGYSGPFGEVSIVLNANGTASVTFTADAGYEFVDSQIADLNVNGNVTVTNLSSDFTATANQSPGQQVDGWGRFNLTIDAHDASIGYTSITFTLTNNSGTWASANDVLTLNAAGYQEAAHVRVVGTTLTGFATEGAGGVPDGGTTVMLLGMALGALGMARRYLKS